MCEHPPGLSALPLPQTLAEEIRIEVQRMTEVLEGKRFALIAMPDPLVGVDRQPSLSAIVDEAIFLEAMDRVFEHCEHECTLPGGHFAAPREQLHRKKQVGLMFEPTSNCD